jgi:hypothetical protein
MLTLSPGLSSTAILFSTGMMTLFLPHTLVAPTTHIRGA